jgi:hypothetical protein
MEIERAKWNSWAQRTNKQILSLGGPHFRHTVSALSFGMFIYMRRKTLQYTSLPRFLVMAMNFVPYGGK